MCARVRALSFIEKDDTRMTLILVCLTSGRSLGTATAGCCVLIMVVTAQGFEVVMSMVIRIVDVVHVRRSCSARLLCVLAYADAHVVVTA